MKFGSFPIEEAEGLVLAHSVRGAAALKKGRIVTGADIAILKASNIASVIGARLEAGDVGEDRAAGEIAEALACPTAKPSTARTGRCNIVAAANGVVRVDKAAVDGANAVDEAVTIATVADMAAVKAGQIIATVKVIPFAVPAAVVARATEALGPGTLTLHPYREKKVALIATAFPGLKPSVMASTEEIIRARVAAVDGTVISSVKIAHDPRTIACEIRAAAAAADLILIVGASATADRADTVPLGIAEAGGVIDHFGMPVDPGNLLVLGHVGPVATLVLPGCARSPKLNGADWVLQRLAADIPVAGRDIMALGVGGLLVDTPNRPLPRAQAVQAPAPSVAPSVCAIVLAAGQSRRMGGRNKLLMEVEGEALVRRTVAAVLAAPVSDVIVVTGYEPEKIEAALRGLKVRFVHNSRFGEGLSASLKAGIEAVPENADGALVCLGDMPRVVAPHLSRLIAGFSPNEGSDIGVPTHKGKRGNPVLWGRRFFKEIGEVSGDVGARHLIGANESLVYEVEFEDTGVLMDLDTPGQWEDFFASSSSPRK